MATQDAQYTLRTPVEIMKAFTDEENDFVNAALSGKNEYATHALDVVVLSWRIRTTTVRDDGLAAMAFFGQFSNSLILCWLSAARYHLVQFSLVLRNAIETGSLCIYSIHDTALATYARQCEGGNWQATGQSATKKAYCWLNRHYPETSARLKSVKDKINNDFAHGTILQPMFSTTKSGDETIVHSLFDVNLNTFASQFDFWLLAHVALEVMLTMEQELSKKADLCVLSDDLHETLLALYANHAEMGAEMFARRLRDKSGR